jgi:hypothetical protein
MISLSRSFLTAAAFLVALAFAATTIKAQDSNPFDPVKVDPQHYKVLYENDEVRILRFDDTPGHKVPKHTHAHPFRVYSVTPSLRQFYIPQDCKTPDPKNPTPVLLVPEDTLPAPPPVINPPPPMIHSPVTHCEANVGVTDAHLIVIEYKKNAPATSAATAQPQRPVKPLRRTPR